MAEVGFVPMPFFIIQAVTIQKVGVYIFATVTTIEYFFVFSNSLNQH